MMLKTARIFFSFNLFNEIIIKFYTNIGNKYYENAKVKIEMQFKTIKTKIQVQTYNC